MSKLTNKNHQQRVYVFGRNTHRRLCNDDKVDHICIPTLSVELSELSFVKILTNASHSFGLTAQGDVFIWGECQSYEDGEQNNADLSKSMTNQSSSCWIRKINGHASCKFVQIATGDKFCIGLGDDGSLHSMMSTEDKEFHLDNHVNQLSKHKIKKICAGYSSVFALTEKGQVYAWSQPGEEEPDFHLGFHQVQFTPSSVTIKDVEASNCSSHVIALTTDNQVYTWGLNNYHQLGVATNDGMVFSLIPHHVKLFRDVPISNILTSYFSTYTLYNDGVLYGWGCGDCGELGMDDFKNQKYPQECIALQNFKSRAVVIGSDHVLVHTIDEKVITWGNDIYGQCGCSEQCVHKDELSKICHPLPQEITFFRDKRVVKCFATLGQSFVIVDPLPWPYKLPRNHYGDIYIVTDM